uniref:RING/U-box protein n=1 Tax=Zea mays TaxID=4577 RepID=A0A804RBJ2_MAIZE
MGTGEGSPPARRGISGRRRRWPDEDDDEYVLEEEEEEDYVEELSASSAGEEGVDSDAEYQEAEEEDEIEKPRPKRPAKGITSSAGERGLDSDAEYQEAEEDEMETPRPKRPAKDSTSSAGEDGLDSDAEYQEAEEEDDDEIETPRPKRRAKGSNRVRKGKVDLAAARSRRRKYEEDEDYEEEVDEDDEVEEEYHDDLEEVEEEEEVAPQRPKSIVKCGARGRNVKLSLAAKRSHQRKQEDDEDMDFDPELDDEEVEIDEDIDFDPDVDGDEEDEYQDEEEEELVPARARKVTVKNPVKRKSISKRRTPKKKKKNRGSKVSRRKGASAKVKKSAPVRRRRKRSVIDDYEDEDVDDDDDDDFIVDDEVIVNRHPKKKARIGSGRETVVDPQVSIEEETWPDLESDSSDFEFATSDEEPNNVETPVAEQTTVRKGRKKRISESESSSDSEFVVSGKELEELREPEPPKAAPNLHVSLRRICITRHGEGKGKEKQEQEEAGKPICGICLSEELRATVQGVLNCCSHYFCFACIMEWSRVESRCPLCKQRFTTITKSSKVDLGLGVRKAVVKVEERDQVYQPTEEEIRRWLDPYENVVCIECNQGGDDNLMLLCDICDSSAHTYCVGLGREVPEGNWYCGGCRLGDEGPSYTGIQRTVAYERQNYRSHVGSSVSFGMAVPGGTFERPSSINPRHSFQGIDLNLSPREFPGESHPAESQVSTDSVSTPTGRAGRTISGRRELQRYIQSLFRPSLPSRPDTYHNIAQNSGGVSRNEPNRWNFPSSSEANTSQNLPDGIQNHHSDLPFVQAHSNFAPFMSPDGDDFQQIEGVKSNLRNMQ